MKKIIVFLFLSLFIVNTHAMKRKRPAHKKDILTMQTVKKQRIKKKDFLSTIPSEIQDIIIGFIAARGHGKKATFAAQTIGNLSYVNKAYYEKINRDNEKIIALVSSNFLCPKENITFRMATTASLKKFELQNELKYLCCLQREVPEKYLIELIEKGVDLEFTYTHYNMQQTPLMMSLYYSNNMYDLLLKHKANINGCNAHGWTIAHLAMHHRYAIGYTSFENIISNKEVDLNKKNKRGNTPLLVLLDKLSPLSIIISDNILRLMHLLKAGADPEIPGKQRNPDKPARTPLEIALQMKNVDIINAMIDAIDAKKARLLSLENSAT
jgi:hypothetical protein